MFRSALRTVVAGVGGAISRIATAPFGRAKPADKTCPANAPRRRRTSRRSRTSRRRRTARRRGTPRKCRIIRGRRYRNTNTPVVLKPTATPAKTIHLFPPSFINQWLLKGGSVESLERACFRGGADPTPYQKESGRARKARKHADEEEGAASRAKGKTNEEWETLIEGWKKKLREDPEWEQVHFDNCMADMWAKRIPEAKRLYEEEQQREAGGTFEPVVASDPVEPMDVDGEEGVAGEVAGVAEEPVDAAGEVAGAAEEPVGAEEEPVGAAEEPVDAAGETVDAAKGKGQQQQATRKQPPRVGGLSSAESHNAAGIATGTWSKEDKSEAERKAKGRREAVAEAARIDEEKRAAAAARTKERLEKKAAEERAKADRDFLRDDEEDDEEDAPCFKCEEPVSGHELQACTSCSELFCVRCRQPGANTTWSCANCSVADREEEDDGEGSDVLDGTASSGPEKKGKGKTKTFPGLKSQHGPLIMPVGDEEMEESLALYETARKAREIEAAHKLKADIRNLTLTQLTEAVCCLSTGRNVSEYTRRKHEKCDSTLYGVDIGTTVRSGARKGKVVKMEMVDGYNEFTIQWPGNQKDSKNPLSYVLRMAEKGKGVVSLEDANKRMDAYFLCLMCMVNVHVHKIVTEDTGVEFKKPTPKLTKRELDVNGVMTARKFAWDEIQNLNGLAMLNPREIELLKSVEDEHLVPDLRKPKSCVRMMGLTQYRSARQLGLVNTEFKFHKKHLPKVNHYIRGAQASFQLGRLTNLASSIMFISKKEIPPGSKAEGFIRDSPDEGDVATFTPVDVLKYSLSVRALFPRARVAGCRESGDGPSSTCQWLKKYPLYRLPFLSRPDGKTIAPNSENGNVCQTRRQKDAFKTVAQMSGGNWVNDVELFEFIDNQYLLTARDKKNASARRETENKGEGLGARVIKGKMHLVGSDEQVDGTNRLKKRVFRNVIDPFMEKLPDRENDVKLCMDVFLQHKRRVGVEDTDENEDHLYPDDDVKRKQIDALVDHMIKVKGVTRVEVSLLSRALTLADNHTAAALRDEDTRGQNAGGLDVIEIPGVHSGEKVRLVRCKLPPFFKNRKAMQAKKTGYPVNHVKDERCQEPFVVMVVIARRIMRKLLQVEWEKKEQGMKNEGKTGIEIDEMREKYTLTPKLGPFSPLGQMYSSKQLGTLYGFCGAWAMGLPYYKSHVIRSIHATAVAHLCIRHGLPEDHPDTLKIFNAARQGDDERISAYSQAMSDMPSRDGIAHLWRSADAALNELRNPGKSVIAGSSGKAFQEFEEIGGFGKFGARFFDNESIPVNIGPNERREDPLSGLELECRELELLVRIKNAKDLLNGCQEVPAPMDIAGTDGGLGVSNGVKRQASEAPEGGVGKARQRTQKRGPSMQKKYDDKLLLSPMPSGLLPEGRHFSFVICPWLWLGSREQSVWSGVFDLKQTHRREERKRKEVTGHKPRA